VKKKKKKGGKYGKLAGVGNKSTTKYEHFTFCTQSCKLINKNLLLIFIFLLIQFNLINFFAKKSVIATLFEIACFG
jgi:hypothetical protein